MKMTCARKWREPGALGVAQHVQTLISSGSEWCDPFDSILRNMLHYAIACSNP
jgi:hypothetical protein